MGLYRNLTKELKLSSTATIYTGKNNGFPFLDILGYLNMCDKSQSGNLVGNSLVGTCHTLPNLGFLWVFFKYPKISKNGNLSFFPVIQVSIPFRSVNHFFQIS